MSGRPTETYSQARRALELYDRLKARGVVNPAEAADEFGCDLRTIQRDMRLLREVLPTLEHVERE